MTGRTKPGEQQFVVKMPDELHAALRAKAEAEDLTMSQVVRLLIREYVKGEKR